MRLATVAKTRVPVPPVLDRDVGQLRLPAERLADAQRAVEAEALAREHAAGSGIGGITPVSSGLPSGRSASGGKRGRK